MFPPVTGTPHSFQMTPHSTWSAVWVRIRAYRRSQSSSPIDRGAGLRERAVEAVPHGVPVLADLGHRNPVQGPGVVGLATPRRVERGSIECHPVRLDIDCRHRRLERAEVRIAAGTAIR